MDWSKPDLLRDMLKQRLIYNGLDRKASFEQLWRRRWSAEQKRAIVAKSLAPGAVVTEIARRAEIGPGQI
jgi:transposase-like protein